MSQDGFIFDWDPIFDCVENWKIGFHDFSLSGFSKLAVELEVSLSEGVYLPRLKSCRAVVTQ